MRTLMYIPLFFSTAMLPAQSTFRFDRTLVECEDRWVVFPMNEDSSYSFGFVYIDAQAGWTLQAEGSFTISAEGKFIPKKMDTNVKMRLPRPDVSVDFIPRYRLAELDVDPVPAWLQAYKTDTVSARHFYRWGFLYNAWNACAKALGYLERAKEIDPKMDGLGVELAFSYNCLKQYDKAIGELEECLQRNPGDAYINKELVYALAHSGQVDEAADACRKAFRNCEDKTYQGENCYNVLVGYYEKGDKANFKIWLKETRKWVKDNEPILNSLRRMEASLR